MPARKVSIAKIIKELQEAIKVNPVGGPDDLTKPAFKVTWSKYQQALVDLRALDKSHRRLGKKFDEAWRRRDEVGGEGETHFYVGDVLFHDALAELKGE